jgi:hypothetical protein
MTTFFVAGKESQGGGAVRVGRPVYAVTEFS